MEYCPVFKGKCFFIVTFKKFCCAKNLKGQELQVDNKFYTRDKYFESAFLVKKSNDCQEINTVQLSVQ